MKKQPRRAHRAVLTERSVLSTLHLLLFQESLGCEESTKGQSLKNPLELLSPPQREASSLSHLFSRPLTIIQGLISLITRNSGSRQLGGSYCLCILIPGLAPSSSLIVSLALFCFFWFETQQSWESSLGEGLERESLPPGVTLCPESVSDT